MGKIVLHLDRMMVERKMSLNELAEQFIRSIEGN